MFDTAKPSLFDKGNGGSMFDKHDEAPIIATPEYTGIIDQDLQADVDAYSDAFKARAEAERLRLKLSTDCEYWCCLVFETRDQKEAFLRAMKWLHLGDKYLDGNTLAEIHRIPLPAVAKLPYLPSKPDRKLDSIALPMGSLPPITPKTEGGAS